MPHCRHSRRYDALVAALGGGSFHVRTDTREQRAIVADELALARLGIVSILHAQGVDVVAETLFIALFAYYTYPNGPTGWTLFPGHYFQFPVFEMLFFGTAWACWSFVRFYQNDKGQTIAERGIEDVKLGTKGKAFVRIMAVSGICKVRRHIRSPGQ